MVDLAEQSYLINLKLAPACFNLFILSFISACTETNINLESGGNIIRLNSPGYPLERPYSDFPECEITITGPEGSRIIVRFVEVILGPAYYSRIRISDDGAFEKDISNDLNRAIYLGYGSSYYDIGDLTPEDEQGKKPIDTLDVMSSLSEIEIDMYASSWGPLANAHDMFKFSLEISAVQDIPKGKFTLLLVNYDRKKSLSTIID